MSSSDLVTAHHLARSAIIYIRQSTPQQVLSNQESLRVQYALQQRAQSLGWPAAAIEIIDSDLGLTASGAHQRPGFNALVAKVTLGEVGLILSFDVTRLARNCSEWYPLLDLCGYKQCLIADYDGIYDPASPNGRLLLGLKGQLSELELHTIRARMTAGLLNKAQRGELALQLPVGLVRDARGQVTQDPNREVQERIALIFTTFLQRRSASKVLQFLNAHALLLPRRDRFGDLVWKRPTVAAILALLKNPAYAGTFVYGRTRTIHPVTGTAGPIQHRLPLDQWKIRVPDVYPAYISWRTFEQIQAMLQDNYAEYDRNKTRGIPRAGAALVHGLVYCGACGHKMLVQYKGGTRYLCNFLRQKYGSPVCQNLPAAAIDAWVVEAFFQALAPVELDVYAAAIAAQQATAARLERARQQHLERLRYDATVAERQFTRADPDNRLVAAELEQRWELALRALKRAEVETASQPAAAVLPLSEEVKTAFSALGQHLPQLWEQPILTQPQKKAVLRCLIDKVVLHRIARDRVAARIVWKGGATTLREVPVPVGALADLGDGAALEQAILALSAAGVADAAIATQLTDQGYRSPMRTTVLPSTVKIIRLRHGVFHTRSQSHPRHIAGCLTVSQIATALDLTPHWIYDRIHNGTVQVAKDPATKLYLFPDEPTTLELFQRLRDGYLQNVRFSTEYQDA